MELGNGEILGFSELEGIAEERKDPFLAAIAHVRARWNDAQSDFEMRTSGSTGKPKIIRHSKSSMRASAELTAAFFDLPQGSSALLCLPPNYVAGSMMIVRALEMNWKLVLIPPRATPLNELKTTVDFAAMTPYQVDESIKAGLEGFDHVKKLIVGGAPVSALLERKIRKLNTEVYATYGMTETLTHIALRRLNGTEAQTDFHCLPGVRYTWDERKCMVIEAAHLDEKKVVTNDRVEPTGMTSFQWLGRIDNVINSGGIKMHPEQIETKLSHILDCRYYIKGAPDEKFGEKVVLVLERSPFDPHTQKLFEDTLKSELGKYEVPTEIEFLSVFEETATGKLIRK